MDELAAAVGGILLVILSVFFFVIIGTLIGAVAGWIVGLVFGDTILNILSQLGTLTSVS